MGPAGPPGQLAANGGPGDEGDADAPRPRLIPGTDAKGGSVRASTQEQADLKQTLMKAGTMIHSRASRDAVLRSLHNPGITVAQAVGKTAAQILMTISAQKQAVTHVPLSPDVMKEAARYVVPELMNIGISAGIFPIRPPSSSDAAAGAGGLGTDDQQSGPGMGADPYNKSLRMAMLEAAKVYGESQLKSPQGPAMTQAAQNLWAHKVREEVANGTADPRYMSMVAPRTKAGSPALIDEGGGDQDQSGDDDQGAPEGGEA